VQLRPQEPPFAGLAAHLIGFYLALHAFFAPEFLHLLVGVYVPVVALMAVLVPVLWLIASPQRFRFMETAICIPYLFMMVWWILAAVVMSFKGYIPEILEYAIRFHAAPVVFCGLLITLPRIRTAMLGYCMGFIVAVVLCRKYGMVDSAGRFSIPETSLGNPNDLALNLLYGIAFLTILLISSGKSKRLLFTLGLLASAYYVLKTGSRANFLTLGILLLVAWNISSARVRTIMILGTVATGLLMAPLIPRHTWIRLVTLDSASAEDIAQNRQLEGAVGSAHARKQLQIRAIKLTFQNPVFGVGPRMFMYALDDYMQEEGFRKGSWQRPHNTYLDISSETGLVGLALYVICMAWCIRTNYRSVRAVQRRPDLNFALAQSCSLLFANVIFAFGTLFCSISFTGQFPFLMSLTAANWLALRDAGAFPTLQNTAPRSFGAARVLLRRRRESTTAPASMS
jgi:hypothetical protein